MKSVSTGAVLVLALFSGLPSAVAAQDWSGFYGGVILGYGHQNSYHCDGADCSGGAPTFPDTSGSGAMAGLTLGYNQMVNGFVIGVEADYMAGKLSGSSPSTGSYGCGGECITEVQGLGTLRVRGGKPVGNALVYLTAGVAFTKANGELVSLGPTESNTLSSPVLGAGVEMDMADNWSVKAEYIHVFAPDFYRLYPGVNAEAVDNLSTDMIRIGLNRKF